MLENGSEFVGTGFGAGEGKVCEVVFNTSVVGYQEIISDPSYAGQIIVMTYPLIGNYGITDEDYESRTQWSLGGLVVRECCDTPSNFRYTKTLEEELEDRGIPCVSGVDTRMLTRIIRDAGSMRGIITDASTPVEEALEAIRNDVPDKDLAVKASCRKRWFSRTPNHNYNVVAVDCGIKHSVIRELNSIGCNVTIMPCTVEAKDILAFNPDGVVFSSGPGAAEDIPGVSELFLALKGRLPIFGIGLGHQVIGTAYGAKLLKMAPGIHGDQPVRDCATGRITIGVLNQNWQFDRDSLEAAGLEVTHVSVPGGIVEGFRSCKDEVFTLMFNPEAAPGPQDNIGLFATFVQMMEDHRNA